MSLVKFLIIFAFIVPFVSALELQGKRFIVSCPNGSVHVFLGSVPNQDGSWLLFYGLFDTALAVLKQTLNFTTVIIPENVFGNFDPIQNIWSGTVGKLIYRHADIGLALTRNYQCNHVISFSTPLAYTWLTFTTNLQDKPKYTWKSIYRPLHLNVWVAFIIGLVACFSKQLNRVIITEFLFSTSWYYFF